MANPGERIRRLKGPASKGTKIAHTLLKEEGVDSKDLPKQLQDIPVKQSKRGQLGLVRVRRITGVENSLATRTLRRFETNIGGQEELLEKLSSISGELKPEQKALLDLLGAGGRKKSLARLVAESGAEPVGVMRAYAKACIELGRVDAAIEAHRHLPALIKNLYKHALDEEDVCKICGGTGTLHAKSSDHKETKVCNYCEGLGKKVNISPHKEFATRQILETTKMVGKEPPQVNVAVGVNVSGGGKSFMEHVLGATDEILYEKRVKSGEIIEGEVINGVEKPGV